LNYRIGTLKQDDVKSKILEGDWEYLLKYDQLSIEKVSKFRLNQDAGRVLWGYEEGKIDFDPTYKYDPGTDIYDTSEKKRTPGWTDRVFYKGKLQNSVEMLFYGCHFNLKMSDHKPVSMFTTCEVSFPK
jgi:inositol polyphosphate 5-phosphatase INPP5B/F